MAALIVMTPNGIALAASDDPSVDSTTDSSAAHVAIVERDGRFELTMDGEPFVVRGAGLAARDAADIEPLVAALAEAGGNAFRIWGSEHAVPAFEAAARHGLKVLVGLDVGTQVAGFDYADVEAVARRHRAVTAFVDRHADDPSVLGWIVGNEPNLAFGADGAPQVADPRVYDAVADIVAHIHEHDPDHPATVAFAFTPTLADDVRTALARVPALDIVSFQGYGALPAIPEVASETAPGRPFMITEFGPLGHWEMPSTDWGREIEEPSGAKAAGIVQRMTPSVTDDPTGRLVGAFAFLWGWKQERTPTWYGLLVEGFGRTASVDELSRFWRGRYPDGRAPSASAITLDGRPPTDSVRLAPGQRVRARVEVSDPEGDALETRWELRTEVDERSDGGLFEAAPPSVPFETVGTSNDADHVGIELVTPATAGEYRLFAYVSDGRGGVATANLPFLVEGAAR